MPIDYSKWNNIEISDDEDEQHPNIDKASLNKWRHEARIQRMEEAAAEKKKLAEQHTLNQQKLEAMKSKLKEVDLSKDEKTAEELAKLEEQEKEFLKKEEELKEKERRAPLNIDTICHEGKSKTIINKSKPKEKPLNDDERMEKQKEFSTQNKSLLKKYGMFRRYDDSENFLLEHPDLACEETANFLVLWCIDLAVEEKNDLMAHVAHQTIVMQFILELAKTMEVDPRACIKAFFHRIKLAEKQYLDAFNDELNSFKERVKERAAVRLEKAMKEVEEEERQKRLGPGGLDPVEVFESLPKALQDCFENKNIPMLQKVISEMDQTEAAYHMKRCVDSGMWVDNAKSEPAEQDGEEASGGLESSGEYETPNEDDGTAEKTGDA